MNKTIGLVDKLIAGLSHEELIVLLEENVCQEDIIKINNILANKFIESIK